MKTQNDWSISKMENAKAEADFNDATTQLTVARNDAKSAHLGVESAVHQDLLGAAYKATADLCAEIAEGNAKFKKIWDAYAAFRNDEYLWWQVAEYTYDNFMIRERAKG